MPKVKVFLAWSGPRSKAVATALRKWLPYVIQDLDPWMSESDVEKGARWQTEIVGELQKSKIGVICLTPDNLQAPWINFEAGALSKLEGSYVCTYLHGLVPTDVVDPLAHFQATTADEEDTRKLMKTLNRRLGEAALDSTLLEESFNKWWKDLEEDLSRAKGFHEQEPPKREIEDMLIEILNTLRYHTTSQINIEVALASLGQELSFIADTQTGRLPATTLSEESTAGDEPSTVSQIIRDLAAQRKRQKRESVQKIAEALTMREIRRNPPHDGQAKDET